MRQCPSDIERLVTGFLSPRDASRFYQTTKKRSTQLSKCAMSHFEKRVLELKPRLRTPPTLRALLLAFKEANKLLTSMRQGTSKSVWNKGMPKLHSDLYAATNLLSGEFATSILDLPDFSIQIFNEIAVEIKRFLNHNSSSNAKRKHW